MGFAQREEAEIVDDEDKREKEGKEEAKED